MLPIQNSNTSKNNVPSDMVLKGYSSNGEPCYGHIIPSNTPFVLKVDGVFTYKNQPILTGTIESGEIHLGDRVFLTDNSHCIETYVAGIELFKKWWSCAEFGDNIGLLLPNANMDWLNEGVVVTKEVNRNDKKRDLQLTEDEKEYLEAYRDACADGSVTDKQRHLLERLRVMYGISEERAREIENHCCPIKLG